MQQPNKVAPLRLKMKQEVIIAIAFDEGYSEQATVMLYSLLANSRRPFTIYAFYNALSESTKNRILSNLSAFTHFTLCWTPFDKSVLDSFSIRKGHVNEYTYTRLFIPALLPKVDRILYLDCDMVITGDVAALWEMNLQGKTLAAVEDLSKFERHEELLMPRGAKYFNAGVLLIDAKKWRADNDSERITQRLLQLGGKAAWWDQDGLNSVLYDDWIQIPQQWNIQAHDVFLAQEEGVKNLKKHLTPKIIHFTGTLKPWNYKSSSPFKNEYYTYLAQTDFKRTHRPQNKTPLNMMRRTVRNVFVKTGLLKY